MLLALVLAVGQSDAPSLPKSDVMPAHYGELVALCGDLDGDGRSEFAIGGAGWEEPGGILIYSGRLGTVSRRIVPTVSGEFIGKGFCATGDLDGDGVRDMALAIGADKGRTSRVEIRSGKTGSTLRMIRPTLLEDQLGAGITSIGDVDGDGCDDLVVSAFHPRVGYTWEGIRWIVISGAHGTRLQIVEWHGDLADGWARSRSNPAATALGDVSGDGVPDFAVIDEMRVRVQSGAALETLREFALPTQYAKRGERYSVCGQIDFDCDGRNDIVVGTPYVCGVEDRHNPYGCLRVYSGADGVLSRSIRRPGRDAGFGYAIVPSADANGDGIRDLWVAQHNFWGWGMWRISGADGADISTVPCETPDWDFGWALATGADVNADGCDDVIVGCWSPFSSTYPMNGAHVLSGRDGKVIHEVYRDPAKAREMAEQAGSPKTVHEQQPDAK